MKNVFTIVLLIFLTGCIGSQKNSQAVNQGSPRTEAIPVRPASEDLRAEVVELPKEITSAASNNATQQSLTGLGVQVGKMAEVLQASLLRMENTLSAQITMKNQLNATASANAEFKARMEATAKAIAKLDARVDAALNASLQAQAGLNNRIDQVSTSAGRDAISSTQFTEPMKELMSKMVGVIESIILGGVVVCVSGFLTGTITIIRVFVGLIKTMEASRAANDEREDKILADSLKGHPHAT